MSIHYVAGGCFAFSDMTDGGGSNTYDDSYMYKKPKLKTQEEIEHIAQKSKEIEKSRLSKTCRGVTQNERIIDYLYDLLIEINGIHSVKELKALSTEDIFHMKGLDGLESEGIKRDDILIAILKARDHSL